MLLDQTDDKYKMIYKFVNIAQPYTYSLQGIFRFICGYIANLAQSIQTEERIPVENSIIKNLQSENLKDIVRRIPLLVEVIKNTIEIEFNSQDCRKVNISDMFQIVIMG